MRDEAGRDAFHKQFNVSRETIEKLDEYAALLRKWTRSINLVSKSTLDEIWQRHFQDSAQVLGLAEAKSGHWVDIGTGGGFPGMVAAVLAAESAPQIEFTFVESDLRKAVFLRTVVRELSISARIVSGRIEEVPGLEADFLSARALAPVSMLLDFAERHLRPDGTALFMKGASYRQELDEALENWAFESHECPSNTDGAAVILKIGDIRRV